VTTMPVLRLLLVDELELIRLGLTALFGSVPRFVVVGEASRREQAVAEARRLRPDVVIMDVRLPDGSGVQACREIRAARPETRVLILTSCADEDAIMAAIIAGAAGYLLKQGDPQRLIEAVDLVARGGSLLDPLITDTVLGWIRRLGVAAPHDPLAGLSEHERKILPLIAEGKTNREIAERLFLSESTVKSYVSAILQKLRLTRRAEAAAFIARNQQRTAS